MKLTYHPVRIKTVISTFELFFIVTIGILSLNSVFSLAQAGETILAKNYQYWQLPDVAPSPPNNIMDEKKANIGKMLFFDPRVSGNGKMSCATCHDPNKGWSDGLATGRGHEGKILGRATPTIYNVGFNKILMWDGRNKSLEDQALGPINNPDEMHNTTGQLIKTLKGIPGYVDAFKEAFWGLSITESNLRKTIAMYQRKIVANRSAFDTWLTGKSDAMTDEQKLGFQLFIDPEKANCAHCHRAPNFTDNGFHNIGLKSFAKRNPDLGRHSEVPVDLTKGAFKTPPLRNIALTAPYFHDGSASTLNDVMQHYLDGGQVKTNLSPNMRVLNLNGTEKNAIVAFLHALTSEIDPSLTEFTLPD